MRYIEFESTRRLDGSAGITRFAIKARAVFWVAPTYLFDQMPVLVTAYPWICSLSGGPDPDHPTIVSVGKVQTRYPGWRIAIRKATQFNVSTGVLGYNSRCLLAER